MPFVATKRHENGPIVGIDMPSVGFAVFQAGFSIMELVTVLTIVGILSALASPSIINVIQSNRLATATNTFIGSLNLARSEALKYSSNAILCKSDDGATCTDTGTWDNGWVVFVDRDNDGAWSADDVLIRRAEPIPGGIALTGAADTIVYSRQGFVTAGNGSYELCSSRIGKARTIDIAIAGRYQLEPRDC